MTHIIGQHPTPPVVAYKIHGVQFDEPSIVAYAKEWGLPNGSPDEACTYLNEFGIVCKRHSAIEEDCPELKPTKMDELVGPADLKEWTDDWIVASYVRNHATIRMFMYARIHTLSNDRADKLAEKILGETKEPYSMGPGDNESKGRLKTKVADTLDAIERCLLAGTGAVIPLEIRRQAECAKKELRFVNSVFAYTIMQIAVMSDMDDNQEGMVRQ